MENLPAGSELFLDAAYGIALSAPTDQYHAQAVALGERGIPAALTPDEHFRQAGFRVLLEGP